MLFFIRVSNTISSIKNTSLFNRWSIVMLSDELNQIFVAEDLKAKQPYKISNADLCRHSIIVDSIGSEMHSKILSKFFDHQIAQNSPLMLIQYKADHNKNVLQGVIDRLGRSSDYKDLNEVILSFMPETLHHLIESQAIIYADLKEGKTDFYDYLMDLLPSIATRINTKQPLHIIITQFNHFDHAVWERLIHAARKANIRLTFVYDHYPDVLRANFLSHNAIIYNTYTHFIFKQDEKAVDLVNYEFNLINRPTNLIGRLAYYLFDRKKELKYLKSNECLVRKNMDLAKLKF